MSQIMVVVKTNHFHFQLLCNCYVTQTLSNNSSLIFNLFIKKQNKSTNSLDNLSDDETDAIIDELSQMKIAKSRKVGLVM